VFTDESAFADADQFLGRDALLRIEVVFLRHGVEVLEDASAQVALWRTSNSNRLKPVRFGGRMLVELGTLVLELESAVLLEDFSSPGPSLPDRAGTHRAEPWCQVGM